MLKLAYTVDNSFNSSIVDCILPTYVVSPNDNKAVRTFSTFGCALDKAVFKSVIALIAPSEYPSADKNCYNVCPFSRAEASNASIFSFNKAIAAASSVTSAAFVLK